jgi:hypothetical protein
MWDKLLELLELFNSTKMLLKMLRLRNIRKNISDNWTLERR